MACSMGRPQRSPDHPQRTMLEWGAQKGMQFRPGIDEDQIAAVFDLVVGSAFRRRLEPRLPLKRQLAQPGWLPGNPQKIRMETGRISSQHLRGVALGVNG